MKPTPSRPSAPSSIGEPSRSSGVGLLKLRGPDPVPQLADEAAVLDRMPLHERAYRPHPIAPGQQLPVFGVVGADQGRFGPDPREGLDPDRGVGYAYDFLSGSDHAQILWTPEGADPCPPPRACAWRRRTNRGGAGARYTALVAPGRGLMGRAPIV